MEIKERMSIFKTGQRLVSGKTRSGEDEEERRNKIKIGLKKIDDLKKVLENLMAALKKISSQTKVHSENEKNFAEILGMFAAKDRENPVPQEMLDSTFILGMERFSQILVEMSVLEGNFSLETDDYCNKINKFIIDFLDKNAGPLKSKIRAYESSRGEYDKIIVKIQRITKDPKKIPVVKLYEAQKERSKLEIIYEKAAEDMLDHVDDIDDLLNTKLLEDEIHYYNAQKKLLGASFTPLHELTGYLSQIKEACKKEAQAFEETKVDRERDREGLQKEEFSSTKKHLAQLFCNSPELVQIVIRVGAEKEIDNTVIQNSFVSLLKNAGVQIPEHIKGEPKVEEKYVEDFIKDNFDSIGMKLLEDPTNTKHKDLLISVGGAISSLVQLSNKN